MIWTQSRQDAARAAAAAWAGTPHRNRLELPQEGVDCIRFVLAVLRAAEVLPARRLPFYDERLGMFRSRNVMEDLFVRYFHATAHRPEDPPAFGDLVVCRCGRQTNHVGIMLDQQLWHVPSGGHVGPEPWEIWIPRVQSLVRIDGIGFRQDPERLTWREILKMSDSKA